MTTTCLIVDDEKLARELLREYLESFPQIEIIAECEGGKDAVAKIDTLRPDLIFLDLVMPNANGYEICAQLRKLSHFRNTPIVILTGNDGIVDRVRAKLVGASDFLGKPIDAGIVLSVLRKHLKQGAQLER